MRDYFKPKRERFPGRRKEAKKDGCCVDCGHDIIGNMSPPYSKRLGHDGEAMTRAAAISLFVTPRGGRCYDCYLTHDKAEVSRVSAQHRADPTIRTRPWPDFGGFWQRKGVA